MKQLHENGRSLSTKKVARKDDTRTNRQSTSSNFEQRAWTSAVRYFMIMICRASILTCRDSASIDILGSFRQLSFSTVVCWLRNDNDDVCVSIWSVHFLVQYLLVIT